MTAETIFIEAWRQGVELDAAGNKIRYRPAERLSGELAAVIVEHREALLQFLHPDAWIYCAGGACKVAAFNGDHVLVVLRSRPDRFEWIRYDELRLSPINEGNDE